MSTWVYFGKNHVWCGITVIHHTGWNIIFDEFPSDSLFDWLEYVQMFYTILSVQSLSQTSMYVVNVYIIIYFVKAITRSWFMALLLTCINFNTFSMLLCPQKYGDVLSHVSIMWQNKWSHLRSYIRSLLILTIMCHHKLLTPFNHMMKFIVCDNLRSHQWLVTLTSSNNKLLVVFEGPKLPNSL